MCKDRPLNRAENGACVYVIVLTKLPPSPVILWIKLGGKPKWLPLNFGYRDFMRTSPVGVCKDASWPLNQVWGAHNFVKFGPWSRWVDSPALSTPALGDTACGCDSWDLSRNSPAEREREREGGGGGRRRENATLIDRQQSEEAVGRGHLCGGVGWDTSQSHKNVIQSRLNV